jgi:putative protein-disulfide isomerase
VTHLIYVFDPMCSWCYGFGPELSGLLTVLPQARLDIVVGGLRPFNTQVMDGKLKDTLLSHWAHVAEASGLPFNQNSLAREDFVYDTEPACRALVAVRRLLPDLSSTQSLAVCHAVQAAFYAQALDVTQGAVLAQVVTHCLLAAGEAMIEAQFLAAWEADETKRETIKDFEQSQRWGITGFPTLVLVKGDELYMLASGYTKTATLLDHLHHIDARAG